MRSVSSSKRSVLSAKSGKSVKSGASKSGKKLRKFKKKTKNRTKNLLKKFVKSKKKGPKQPQSAKLNHIFTESEIIQPAKVLEYESEEPPMFSNPYIQSSTSKKKRVETVG